MCFNVYIRAHKKAIPLTGVVGIYARTINRL